LTILRKLLLLKHNVRQLTAYVVLLVTDKLSKRDGVRENQDM
jgi:hypothetical protein